MAEPLSRAESCPVCGGRGWVIVNDSGTGSARACDCRLRDRGRRLVTSSGLPERYLQCRLSNFNPGDHRPKVAEQLQRALAASRGYVEGFLQDSGKFCDSGLIFIGPPGVGKTHLASAVLLELIERYKVRGRFVEFTDLLNQIQATFAPGSTDTKSEILAGLIDAELLVLDELGAQKPTAWVQDILYLLINSRYTQRRPTIFTTNFRLENAAPSASLDRGASPPSESIEALSYRLPATLVSRLYEMARPVLLDAAEDFRREVTNLARRA